MNSGPLLRATDASGQIYDDPSEDALFMLMEDIEAPGSSLVVARTEQGREEDWARVTLSKGGLYEFESSQNVGYVSSLRNVHEFLTRWAFDLDGGDAPAGDDEVVLDADRHCYFCGEPVEEGEQRVFLMLALEHSDDAAGWSCHPSCVTTARHASIAEWPT